MSSGRFLIFSMLINDNVCLGYIRLSEWGSSEALSYLLTLQSHITFTQKKVFIGHTQYYRIFSPL